MEHGYERVVSSWWKENDNNGGSLSFFGSASGKGIRNDGVDDPHVVRDRDDSLGEHDCCWWDVGLLLEFAVAAGEGGGGVVVVEDRLKGSIVSSMMCQHQSFMPSGLTKDASATSCGTCFARWAVVCCCCCCFVELKIVKRTSCRRGWVIKFSYCLFDLHLTWTRQQCTQKQDLGGTSTKTTATFSNCAWRSTRALPSFCFLSQTDSERATVAPFFLSTLIAEAIIDTKLLVVTNVTLYLRPVPFDSIQERPVLTMKSQALCPLQVSRTPLVFRWGLCLFLDVTVTSRL